MMNILYIEIIKKDSILIFYRTYDIKIFSNLIYFSFLNIKYIIKC